jgi:hypothetical protein
MKVEVGELRELVKKEVDKAEDESGQRWTVAEKVELAIAILSFIAAVYKYSRTNKEASKKE